MSKQEAQLTVAQLEGGCWNSLLMGALTEDPQFPEPLTDTGRMPSVAVPADQQLMPGAAARIALYRAAKLVHCGFRHDPAVELAARRVAHGLVLQVAPIADQLAEQCHSGVRPAFRIRRFGQFPGQSQPVALL